MTNKDYRLLEKHTEFDSKYADYVDQMFKACYEVGLTDVVIYCDGREGYQGDMDIHVEAKLNGVDVYYYLNQGYGSCSYCDWIQHENGEEEVKQEYIKNLKEALGIEL